MKKLTIYFSLSLLLVNLSCSDSGPDKKAGSESGLPHFIVQTLDGQELGAGDFAGKVLVVDFWATWCKPCLSEIPAYNRLNEKYQNENFAFLGIEVSANDGRVLKDFATQYDIRYPIYLGSPETVAAFGNITVLPTTFLIDQKGNVADKFLGAAPYKSKDLDSGIANLLQPATN